MALPPLKTALRVCAGALVAAMLLASQAPSGAATDGGGRQAVVPPRLLSETGLFLRGVATQVDPRNRPFSPQYPLWSDGATKQRWIYLPSGTTIGTRNVDRWDFPVGTRFWKEFAFEGRRVETRFLWQARPGKWVFATYVWRPDGLDAVLAPPEGIPDVLAVAPGRTHSIPSAEDCRACHDADHREVLGFTALQLSADRDPNALHAEPLQPGMLTLPSLAAGDLLKPARPELIADPPRIVASSPRGRAALGYLATNCGVCHNQNSSLKSLGLFLDQSVRTAALPGAAPNPALASTVARQGKWEMPGGGPHGRTLITPGSPDASALLYRVKSRRPSSQMPPLGTVLVDRSAVDLLSEWITRDLPADRP